LASDTRLLMEEPNVVVVDAFLVVVVVVVVLEVVVEAVVVKVELRLLIFPPSLIWFTRGTELFC